MKGINPLVVAGLAAIVAVVLPFVGSDYAISFSIQLLICWCEDTVNVAWFQQVDWLPSKSIPRVARVCVPTERLPIEPLKIHPL